MVQELPLPVLTGEERIAFAICIAPHQPTRKWAVKWLSGTDRSKRSARHTAIVHLSQLRTRLAVAARLAALAVVMKAEGQDVAFKVAEAVMYINALESSLLPTLTFARSILAGETSAEEYDFGW